MKHAILLLVFTFCSLHISAQTHKTTEAVTGDSFTIGKPATNNYMHINFPKANTIAKRGGIANYDNQKGLVVIVTSVKHKQDGSVLITLKRKEGKRFFGSHNYISANYDQAIDSGELQKL